MTRHRLRHTLMAVFLLLALLGGACGAVGLIYVGRINATVTLHADVTSPMLANMMQLVEDSLRSRAKFGATWRQEAPDSDDMRNQLEAFHALASGRLDRLRQQAAAGGLDVDLDRMEALEAQLVEAVELSIANRRRLDDARADVERADAAFGQAHRIAAESLAAISLAAQTQLSVLEERTKIGVQTQTATVETLGREVARFFNQTHQVLEKSRLLTSELQVLDDAAGTLTAVAQQPRTFDDLTGRLAGTFETIDAILAMLGGRLSGQQDRPRFEALRDAFDRIRAAMLGSDGLVASALKAATARRALQAETARAGRIEASYYAILDDFRRAITRRNLEARRFADRTIANARLAVGATLAFVVIAAVLLATWMSRRITRPLGRLTDHAVAIGDTGLLEPLPSDELIRRQDEIATLALAFNRMIGELAEARRQLITQSEEEVRIQYGRLNAALSNMPQGLAMFDSGGRLVVCNDRYRDLYALGGELTKPGVEYETLVRAALEQCEDEYIARNGGDIEGMVAVALTAFRSHRVWVRELRQQRTVAVRHTPMADGGVVTTHEDITERRRAEARIAYMAMHDMLTDLANRTAFREKLAEALAHVNRGEEMAVLYFDLDHFKHVNDTLGHPVGDALLRAVAQRLRACVRETDTVARLGGDEFAIVQVSLGQPRGAAELAARLVTEIGRPYLIDGQTVVIGVSVGIALAPTDGTDADLLLRNADMALYRSKTDGRGTYTFFEPAMDAKMQARRLLELELRRALALDEFELYYQPLVNAMTGRVTGCEALLRWHHPERGTIPPREFIPVAEEIGLLTELGAWILREACKAAAGWPPELRVAVNLSPTQFNGGRLPDHVRQALEGSGLEPGRLELEITEDLLVRDPDATIDALFELRSLGVHVTMDDFGTGYSSLGYLRRFPFDKIKIDHSFVHDMAGRRDAVAIVRAVNGLATALGIETVAEGVETDEHLANARSEGCSAIQGEFFSGPVPLDEVADLLNRQMSPTERPPRRDAA